MKLKQTIAVAAILASIGFVETLRASVLNGGFESGNVQEWRLNIPRASNMSGGSPRLTGNATVTSHWSAPNNPSTLRSALEGSYFTVLGSSQELRLSGGRAFNISLTQRIHLRAGERISGAAGFYGQSGSTRDSAWVNVLDGDGISLASPWRSPSSMSGSTLTGWNDWSWQATADGDYYVGLGLTTYCSETSPSYGFFDDILVHPATSITPVPEPSAMGLTAVAVAVMAALRKKRNDFWP